MPKTSFGKALCVCVVAVCNACSNAPVIDGSLGITGAPDWVNKSSYAVSKGDKAIIYAVGSASPVGDLSFQISIASDRARGLIARELTYGVGDAAGNADDATRDDHQQTQHHRADRTMHSLALQSLAGSRIVGQWRDPATQDVYVLVELDLTRAATLAALRSPEDRDAFARYAQRVMDHLAHVMLPATSNGLH